MGTSSVLRGSRHKVAPGERTGEVAARMAGFGSEREYRRAKSVVERGIPELVAKMDCGELSISAAAEIAKLPAEQQAERLLRPGVKPNDAHIRLPRSLFDALVPIAKARGQSVSELAAVLIYVALTGSGRSANTTPPTPGRLNARR